MAFETPFIPGELLLGNFQNIGRSKLKLTDWQLIEDTNSAEIVSDPYRRTQQDKEMDKAHFLLDLKTRTLIRNSRTHIILRQSTRGRFRSKIHIYNY